MLFNSLQFAVFFPVVTALYFLLPHRFRWILLLSASCTFYMAFIPAYIAILAITIAVDYIAAIYIEDSAGGVRKRYLIFSIISTCLVLLVFKYLNFFDQNVGTLARLIGWNYSSRTLQIILPIGLSFHTFQSLSYVIEVYRGNQKAERHFGIYSLYVMFYPQLVAGPIERPQNLLHQFHEPKRFTYDNLAEGLALMAWGLFKKVVIADRLSLYVNEVYGDPLHYSGVTLAIATIAFAYQIYCDFSGYSDIAIGSARVMGFHLMNNFDAPYYSQSIGEFWKRWHISLSTWFRDYVYISLGGNRVTRTRFYQNLMVTFAVSGLWHGANWTFLLWGVLNGWYLVFGHFTGGLRARIWQWSGTARDGVFAIGVRVLTTFCLVSIAWVFFRANSLSDAWGILTRIVWDWQTAGETVRAFPSFDAAVVVLAIAALETVQFRREMAKRGISISALPVYVKWPAYYAMLASIPLLGVFQGTRFIYFQF